MTRCRKNEVNLKSNVYNQTGQNYFERLSAYNSMSLHLRRILSAKSVVDTRNKKYIFMKNRQCKEVLNKDAVLCPEVVNDVIDRLAYDTQHHPMDILKMKLNSKHLHDYNSKHRQTRICNNQTCCEIKNREQQSTLKSPRMSARMKMRSLKDKISATVPNLTCDKELKYPRENSAVIDRSKCCSGQRCVKDPFLIPCTTTALDSSIYKPRTLIQEMSDHRSILSTTSRSYDDSDYDDKYTEQLALKQKTVQKEDERKYVKFAYDITKEIMQSGLYTDKELQDVFQKYIDKNKGILNMNKMLYEIYQLKISLNILDDSDMDEELDDVIHAQQLLSISEIRPPTPPKVLDENKVIEKLKSYQQLMETQCKPLSRTSKSVILVDANPELIVTETDVLISLIEAGIDPKQAQHICKSLLYKSRDTIQTKAETSYTPNMQKNPKKVQNTDDKQICSKIVINENECVSVIDNSTNSAEKQEATSSTSNLVSTQDKIIEIEEITDSQTPINNNVEL